MTWALSVAGGPIDFVWRQPRSIYYHPDIHEVPDAISFPSTPALESSIQPLAILDALSLPEALKGSNHIGDQGQGAKGKKDKGKGKRKKPSAEAKDREAAIKAKKAKTKT